MPAIISGQQLGLSNSSISAIGNALGDPLLGQNQGQVHINAATGNLVLQNQDLIQIGLGSDINLLRTYNSSGRFEPNDAFRFNWQKRIEGTHNDRNVVVYHGDGSYSVFQKSHSDENGRHFISTDGRGAHDTLTYQNHQWTMTEGSSQTKYVFGNHSSSNRQLVSVTDSEGWTTSIEYTTWGDVKSVEDSSGQRLEFDYVNRGNRSLVAAIRSMKGDNLQGATHYQYDALNRLTKVIVDLDITSAILDDNGDGTLNDQSDSIYVTEYQYYQPGEFIGDTRVLNHDELIKSVRQTDGTLMSVFYVSSDSGWRVKSTVVGEGSDRQITRFDYHERRTDVTQVLDTAYEPVNDNSLVSTTFIGRGITTSYIYDDKDRLYRVISSADENGQRLVTSYHYDSDDNVVSVTDGRNQTTYMTYDDRGNLLSRLDAAGNTEKYTYNEHNQLARSTRFLQADPDGLGPLSASESQSTWFVYDDKNRLRFSVDAQGQVTETRYDENSVYQRKHSEFNYSRAVFDLSAYSQDSELSLSDLMSWVGTIADYSNVQRTDRYFDFRDQLTQVIVFSKTDAVTGEGADKTTVKRFIYNEKGQVLQSFDLENTIDWNNVELREVVVDGGWPTELEFRSTSYQYDGMGRLLSRVDAAENMTQYFYGAGLLESRGSIAVTHASGLRVLTVSNSAGQVVHQLEQAASLDTYETKSERHYFYDALGRQIGTLDPTGVLTQTIYDDSGRRIATIDGNGAMTEFRYNENGLVIEQIAYDGFLAQTQIESMLIKDDQGRIVGLIHPEKSDRWDDLLSDLRPQANVANDRHQYFFYDSADRVIYSVDGEGAIIKNIYDGAGQLIHDIAFSEKRGVETVRALLNPSVEQISDSSVVSNPTENDASDADTAQLVDGRYVSVWTQDGKVFAQIFSAEGIKQDAAILVRDDDYGWEPSGNPVVTQLHDGGFAVFWEGLDSYEWDPKPKLEWQRFDAEGIRKRHNRYLSGFPYYEEGRLPAVTTLEDGSVVVVQQLYRRASSFDRFGWDVHAVRLAWDEDEQTLGTISPNLTYGIVSFDEGDESKVDIAALDNGGFVMTWQATDGDSTGIKGKRFYKDGIDNETFVNDDFFVNQNTIGEQSNASVIQLKGGEFFSAWHSINELGESVIQARRYGADSFESFNDYTIAIDEGLIQEAMPKVTELDDGSLIIVWQSLLNGDAVIRVQHLDALGEKKHNSFILNGADASIQSITIESLFGNRAVVNWSATNNEGHQVVRQQLIGISQDPKITNGWSADNNRVSNYLYDASGKLLATIDQERFIRTWKYNAAGQLIEQRQLATRVSDDQFNNGLLNNNSLNEVNLAVDNNDRVTRYFYNQAGQQTAVIDAERFITAFEYDGRGNQVLSKRFFDRVPEQTTNEAWRELNIDNWLTASDSREFRSNESYFNELNQLSWSVDDFGLKTENTYDVVGQLTRTSSYDIRVAENDRVKRTTLLKYDLQGRMISQQNALAVNAGDFIRYAYDRSGRMISTTDANNHVVQYLYDDASRITHVVNGAGEVSQTEYNAFGDLVALKQFNQRLTTEQRVQISGGLITSEQLVLLNGLQDEFTSLERSEYDRRGLVIKYTDAEDYVRDYAYNLFSDLIRAGQQISKGSNERAWVELEYSNLGQLESQKQYLTPESPYFTESLSGNANIEQYNYDAYGQRIELVDANQVAHTTTFDRLGRQLESSIGDRKLSVTEYDAFNRTTRLQDARGFNTTFEYDQNNNGYSLLTPEGVNVIYKQNAFGETIEVTDSNQSKTQYHYDLNGNQTQILRDGTQLSLSHFDSSGQKLSAIDANGNRVVFEYDAAQRLVRQILEPAVNPVTQVVSSDALNLVTEYKYDGKGLVMEVTDPNLIKTKNTYNLRGELVEVTQDPGGLRLTSRYEFDGTGNRLEILSGSLADDNQTLNVSSHKTQVFDALGRLKEVITHLENDQTISLKFELDSNGNVIRMIDGNQNPSIFVYDNENRLTFSVDGTGAVTKSIYDSANNVVETLRFSERVNVEQMALDVTVDEVEALLVTASSDALERSVFDSDGRVSYTVNAVGAVSKFEYDGNNNIVKTIRYSNTIAVGTEPQNVVADITNDRVNRTLYDQFNRVTHTIDGSGAVIAFEYDNNGNTTKTTAYAQRILVTEGIDDLVGTPSLDQVTLSRYDSANRLTYSVDAEGGVRYYQYDGMGNKVQETRYANTISLNQEPSDVVADSQRDQVMRSAYDSSNRLTYSVDARGAVTSYLYDDNNNIIGSTQFANRIDQNTAPDAVIADHINDRSVTATYDTASRLIYAVDALGGVTKNEYDTQGNLIAKTWFAQRLTAGQEVTDVVADSTKDQRIRAEFDAANRMIYSIDAEGAVVGFEYDARNNLTKKIAYFTRISLTESANNTVVNTQKDQVTRAQFNSADQMVYSIDGEGAVSYFEYDAFGKTIKQTEYATPIALSAEPSTVQLSSQFDRTTEYEYDRVGRQTKTIYPPIGIYHQEDIGSIISNGKEQLAQRNESETTLYTQAYYDAFGNIVANRNADGQLRFQAYDANNNISYSVDSEGYVTSYQRDTFGNTDVMTRYQEKINQSSRNQWQLDNISEGQVSTDLITSNRDRSLVMAYNLNNQVTEVTEPSSYVFDGSQGFMAQGKTIHQYNSFGQLEHSQLLQNANEWVNIYHYYDRTGQKIASVDAQGFLTKMRYDSFGNLEQTVEYAKAVSHVDSRGYIESAFDAGEADIIGQNRVMAYEYDRNNRKVSETRVNVEYSLNNNGTRVQGDLTNTYQYDSFGNIVVITDAKGNETFTYYDKENRTSAVVGPKQEIYGLGQVGTLTEFNRDVFGNVIDQKQYANGSMAADVSQYQKQSDTANDRTTSIQYDRWGRTIEVTNARGSKTFMSYNANGQVAKQWSGVTGNDGITRTVFTAYQYDQLGRVIKMITPTSNQDDVVVNLLAYNGFGELTSRGIDGIDGGQSEFFEYDDAGRLWRTNRTGTTIVMLYDLQGNLTSEIIAASTSLSSVTNAQVADAAANRRLNNEYDGGGNIIRQVVPNGGVINQTYDRWNNRLSFSDARNANWITQFTYNENNHVTSEVKPEITVQWKVGNLVTETKVKPTNYYYYNYAGNQVALRDERNFVNSNSYDMSGNILTERHADGGLIQHKYNIFGDKVKSIDAENNVTEFKYDQGGNLTQIIKPEEAFGYYIGTSLQRGTFEATLVMTYDELGRKLTETMNNESTNISYKYDVRGNVVELNKFGQVTRSEFNKQDRKTKETNAINHYMTWEYDYFGRQQAKRDFAGKTYSFSYYADGQIDTETNSRSRYVKHHYNQAGELTQVVDRVSGNKMRTTDLSYDLNGRRASEKTTIDGVVYQDQYMEYDELGRLKKVTTQGNKTVNYEYDAADNRIRVSENVGGALRNAYFAFDSMNRQVLIDGANNNDVTDLGNLTDKQGVKVYYDKNGNRTYEYSGIQGKDRTQQIFDDHNRLATMNKWDAASGTYKFLNERVYDKRSRMVFLTDAFKNINYDVNDNLTKQQLLKDDGSSSVEATLTNQYNGLNNLIKSTRSGEVTLTNHYKYQAYGNQYKQTEFKTTRSDNTGQPGVSTFGYDVNGYLTSLTDARNGDNNRSFYNDNSGIALLKQPASGSNGKVHNLIVSDRVIGTWGNDFDPDQPNQDISLTTNEGDTLASIAAANNPKTASELYAGHKSLLTNVEILNDEDEIIGYKTLEQLSDAERATAVLQSGQTIVLKNMPAYATLRDFVDYQTIDQAHPGSTLGQHVVKSGETLRSIAQATYGSAQLWYVIANANGFSSDADLRVGNNITLPSVINGEINNATSFQPYDASIITGDTSPYTPPPEQNDDGCAKIAIIIVAVIAAVAITVLTAGAGAAIVGPAAGVVATAAAGAAAGAVGGALGSAAAQGILIAGGVQEEFSWTEVGIGAITGFIGGGLLGGASAIGTAAKAGSLGARAAALAANAATVGRAGQAAILAGKTAGYASVAVINEAVSQGVRIAAGEQEQFNWTYVASAAVMGAFGGFAGSVGKAGSSSSVAFATFGDVAGAALGNVIVNKGGFEPTQFIADAAGSLAGGALTQKSAQFGRQIAKDRAESRARSVAVTEAPHKRRINAVTRFGDNVDGAVKNLASKVGHVEIPHSRIGEFSGADSRLVVAGHGGRNTKGEFTVGGKTATQMAQTLAATGATEFSRISLAACHAGDSEFPNQLYKALDERGVKVGSITARQTEVRVAPNGQKYTQGASGEMIHKGAKVLITSANASDNRFVQRTGKLVSQAEMEGVSDPLPSLSRDEVIKIIEAEAGPAVKAVLDLDPDAKIGFRGSVATGLKGPHKLDDNMGRVPFDGVVSFKFNKKTNSFQAYKGAQGYDIDFFVVSDKLAAQFGRKDRFRDLMGQDINVRNEFNELGNRLVQQLGADPKVRGDIGLKAEQVDVRVWTSAQMAKKIADGDTPIFFPKPAPDFGTQAFPQLGKGTKAAPQPVPKAWGKPAAQSGSKPMVQAAPKPAASVTQPVPAAAPKKSGLNWASLFKKGPTGS